MSDPQAAAGPSTRPGPESAPVLPPRFLWGAATAAYQIEGAVAEDGRGVSVWDTFSRTPGNVLHGDTGDVACDHYHRWQEDLDLLAGLGVDAYRFSVAWPRVVPAGRGGVDQRGLDFYRRLTDGLLERGITPCVTLYHWDLPQPLEDAGGWLDRDCAGWFADYAEVVVAALADRVPLWITLNEPISSSLYWYGGRLDPLPAGVPTVAHGQLAAAHHHLLGHGEAMAAFRAAAPPGAGIGITLNVNPVRPARPDAADVEAAHRADVLQTRWFQDAVLLGAYPQELVEYYAEVSDLAFVRDGDLERIAAPLDFLGVNYYKTWEAVAAAAAPPDRRSAVDVGADVRAPAGAEVTGFGWPVTPDGMREVLVTMKQTYPDLPPVLVTENGCAYDDYADPAGRVHDPERISFVDRYLAGLAAAVAEGVDVRGYFYWSLLDNFEWTSGYSKRFGLVYVHYPTGERIPKTSYAWYRDLIATHRAQADAGTAAPASVFPAPAGGRA